MNRSFNPMFLLLFGSLFNACGWLSASDPQPAERFNRAKGRIQKVAWQTADTPGPTQVWGFTLSSDAGLEVRGRLRAPKKEGAYPVAFVVAAYESGSQAIDIIEGCDDLAIVSIDYPIKDHSFSLTHLISDISDLRQEGIETVASILLTLDWLSMHPLSVDSSNITIVTVSFGTFTGIPAAALDPRASRLAVIQGGGDLSRVIAANSRRLGLPLPPRFMGWLSRRLLPEFEPNDYIGQVSPRPVVIFGAEDDAYFPEETTLSLYDHAGEPKEIVWRPGGGTSDSKKCRSSKTFPDSPCTNFTATSATRERHE
ncbi:MAG: alpha/beta hydrolase family protein [bacterium]